MRGFGGCKRILQLCILRSSHTRFHTTQTCISQKDVGSIFQRRMEIAGVSQHDHIAISVSGGVDSMALCLLTLKWKKQSGNFNKLIGLTYGENAEQVYKWLTNIGMECEILKCNSEQIPSKQIPETGRYIILYEACRKLNIDVLLSGHNADDLAGIFIWRLSHGKGYTGLAALPFMNQLFPQVASPDSKNIRVIRPLIDLYKSNLHEVCKLAGQEWLENAEDIEQKFVHCQKSLAALPLKMKDEIQNVIAFYRKRRAELEAEKNGLLRRIVKVHKDFGYALVDADKLSESDKDRNAVAKTLGSVIRFVQQTTRVPRTRVLLKALDWIQKPETEEHFRVGSCLITRLKNSKLLVAVTSDNDDNYSKPRLSPQRKKVSKNIVIDTAEEKQKMRGVLEEPKYLRVISQETEDFLVGLSLVTRMHDNVDVEDDTQQETTPCKQDESSFSGKSKYYMNRFVLSLREEHSVKECNRCINGACIMKSPMKIKLYKQDDYFEIKKRINPEDGKMWESWGLFESLPESVKQGLPVVLNQDDNYLAIPSVGFQFCPNIKMTSKFCPRFPLTGDHMLWI